MTTFEDPNDPYGDEWDPAAPEDTDRDNVVDDEEDEDEYGY